MAKYNEIGQMQYNLADAGNKFTTSLFDRVYYVEEINRENSDKTIFKTLHSPL